MVPDVLLRRTQAIVDRAGKFLQAQRRFAVADADVAIETSQALGNREPQRIPAAPTAAERRSELRTRICQNRVPAVRLSPQGRLRV
jgi:hypothetical protein